VPAVDDQSAKQWNYYARGRPGVKLPAAHRPSP
jgi:hypothetical protein